MSLKALIALLKTSVVTPDGILVTQEEPDAHGGSSQVLTAVHKVLASHQSLVSPPLLKVFASSSTPALTRTCRESYYLYTEIIRTHRITHEQRAWAWERVTSATAAGATHEICRSSDAVNALDEPQQWPLLGGSLRKDGTTVDWRFNESKTHPPGDKDDAAAATDMISSAMRMSATTGLDPLAGFINGVAELSHALRIPTPPAPPAPTPGVAEIGRAHV